MPVFPPVFFFSEELFTQTYNTQRESEAKIQGFWEKKGKWVAKKKS